MHSTFEREKEKKLGLGRIRDFWCDFPPIHVLVLLKGEEERRMKLGFEDCKIFKVRGSTLAPFVVLFG